MINKKVIASLILLCSTIHYGQTKIECGLIELSKLTLDQSPIIQRNQLQIRNAEGAVLTQKSIFDYQLTAGFSLSKQKNHLFAADPRNSLIDGNILETNTNGFYLGLQKRLWFGMIAEVQLDYDRFANNYPRNEFNQDVNPFLSNHTASSTFSLTQPLLRGRGSRVTTALQKASVLELESSENNYKFISSLELLEMATAYWQYLTAYKNLIIFKENEERVRKVLNITEQLVKGDKRPAGDLVQIKADLANQERLTFLSTQNLFTAKLNLGRIIGLSEPESEALGEPTDEFPDIEVYGFVGDLKTEAMIEIATKNRKDLESSENITKSRELQLEVAQNNLKPQLNLTGFASYGGMTMGNGLDQAFDTFNNREGRNYQVGLRLNFAFPLNNNLAKGNAIINQSLLQDQEIVLSNLQRNINLNVSIAVNNLKNNVEVLKKAQENLRNSEEVFKNEQIKFQNGLTTLLNLILFQERLTFAQQNYLQAQQQFAISIANLRFETGTLISTDDTTSSAVIDSSNFYNIPN